MKKHWLRSCDFLNIPMSLSYKNDIFFSTNVGAFLTIFVFLIIMTISAYEIRALYSKSYFTIISNQYTDLSEVIDFSRTPFLFQLTTDKGKVIQEDDNLFQLKAYIVSASKKNSSSSSSSSKSSSNSKKSAQKEELILEKCDKVYTNDIDYLAHLNLSRYFCIKPGQNITAYGLLGDSNNGFKGFRIYLNKCSGKPNCYDESVVVDKLQNSKFIVMFLSLDTNIYSLDGSHLKYQLFSQTLSMSTNLLKKIFFTFSVGRFFLYNSIISKNKIQYDFITLNNQYTDFDLDATSTLSGDENTLAYVSFHYSGNVLEISKEVQRLFDTLVIIGNTFNIILTIFKIINNYYSNKILFADIFGNLFFGKDISINIGQNNTINFKNFVLNQKKNLDFSDELGLNNNKNNINDLNKINIVKKSKKNNSIISIDKENINKKNITHKINNHKKKSHLFVINEKGKLNKKIFYYYIIPYWILKKIRTFENISLIKEKICSYFSIEKISELIRFKENMEIAEKEKRLKMNNTELLQIGYSKIDNNSSNKNIK